jgi:glycosyltransferase involved in cell wall biosynthesis
MGISNTKEVLWLISKYAVSNKHGNATRQYFLSYNFARKGVDISLISSQSSNLKTYKKLNNFYHLEEEGLLKHFLLAGPKINLGFSLLRIWSWIIFEFNLLRLALWHKKLDRPTVIIVSSLSLLSFISGVLLKWRYSAKLILEVRDIWPLSLIEVGGFSKYNPFVILLKCVEKFGYINADAIVGTMPNLEEHIREITRKTIPIYCVPQGFEHTHVVDRLTIEAVNKLELRSRANFNIIYSGTIGKANKVELILEVARALADKAPNIHFYIMGNGPLKDRLKTDYVKLQNITFIDPIKYSEVPIFLSNFDLLIYPVSNFSIYRFGISPNKIIDYMRSGRPILTVYNGFPSLIEANMYSFNVASENVDILAAKVLEISTLEKSTLDKLGQNAKLIVERYHKFDTLSDKYLIIFRELRKECN